MQKLILEISKYLLTASSSRADRCRASIDRSLADSCVISEQGSDSTAAQLGVGNAAASNVLSSIISNILLVVLLIVSAGPPI